MITNNGLANFIDKSRLADPGATCHEKQLGRPMADALERFEERCHFCLAAIEPPRKLEPIRHIPLTQRKWLYGSLGLPLCETPREIFYEPPGALITVLRRFG